MRNKTTRSIGPLLASTVTRDSRLVTSKQKRRSRKTGAGVKRQRRGLLKPNEKAWHPHHDVCLPPGGMTSATAFGSIIGPVGCMKPFRQHPEHTDGLASVETKPTIHPASRRIPSSSRVHQLPRRGVCFSFLSPQ
jgi:hypothetical protein